MIENAVVRGMLVSWACQKTKVGMKGPRGDNRGECVAPKREWSAKKCNNWFQKRLPRTVACVPRRGFANEKTKRQRRQRKETSSKVGRCEGKKG